MRSSISTNRRRAWSWSSATGRAGGSTWWLVADGVFSTLGDKLFPKSTAPEFSGLVVYYCIAKGEHLPEEVHTEHFISQGGLGFRQVTVAGGGSDGRWDSLQLTTRGPPCSSEWAAEGTVEDMRGYLDLAGDACLPGARQILENADHAAPQVGDVPEPGARVPRSRTAFASARCSPTAGPPSVHCGSTNKSASRSAKRRFRGRTAAACTSPRTA